MRPCAPRRANSRNQRERSPQGQQRRCNPQNRSRRRLSYRAQVRIDGTNGEDAQPEHVLAHARHVNTACWWVVARHHRRPWGRQLRALERLDPAVQFSNDPSLGLGEGKECVDDIGHVGVIRVGVPLDAERLDLVRGGGEPRYGRIREAQIAAFHARQDSYSSSSCTALPLSSYRRGIIMEPVIWVISIAAFALSVAALVVAIRGARRDR